MIVIDDDGAVYDVVNGGNKGVQCLVSVHPEGFVIRLVVVVAELLHKWFGQPLLI